MATGGTGHAHAFDNRSGWCAYCNLRQDGRLISKGGDIIHAGRGYTPTELDDIRNQLTEVTS